MTEAKHTPGQERIITYRSENADAGKEWLAKIIHPRTALHIFFEGTTEAAARDQALAFWDEHRREREEAWARLAEARAKRKEKSALTKAGAA